jgi:hypothetical protein
MGWFFAGLVFLIWWLHGHSGGGGVPDAGGLTPAQKNELIAAQNKAAAALKAANAAGFLLLRWTEIRLMAPDNHYITILEDGSSDYVNYSAAGLRAEVCHYTKSAAELLSQPSLEYC